MKVQTAIEFSMDEEQPIKALGSLFKFTEAYLWENGPTEVREIPYFREPVQNDDGDFLMSESNKFYSSLEDEELAKQLDELGLPLSFQTNKERKGKVSGKTKDTRKKNLCTMNGADLRVLESIKVGEEESSIDISHDTAMLNQNEIMKCDITADIGGFHNICSEGKGLGCPIACCTRSVVDERDNNDEVSDLKFDNDFDCSSGFSKVLLSEVSENNTTPCTNDMDSHESCLLCDNAVCDGEESKDREPEGVKLPDDVSTDVIQDCHSAPYSKLSEAVNSDIDGSHKCDSEEWITCWDDFYSRSYFYNLKTQESTWDPPSGMEDLASGLFANELKAAELDAEFQDLKESDEVQVSCGLQPDSINAEQYRDDNGFDQQFEQIVVSCLSADNISSSSAGKRKKKVRRTKSNRNLSISSEELHGILEEFSPSIGKYWSQRHLLFSRYNDGIQMDEEGWFSVTPEPIAKHHASRCGSGCIVDFFAGVGGNAIQFAQRSNHVITIDIDPNKIGYAQQNAAVYEVDDRIDFIRGDSFCLAPRLKADTVFMSPPWGGPDYVKVKKFDIKTMLKPRDGLFLFNTGKKIASRIVMFLPRNVDISQLAELSLSASPPWSLEVEKNYLNGRFKAITAYFSAPILP